MYIYIHNEYNVCYHNVRTMYLKSKEKKRYQKKKKTHDYSHTQNYTPFLL